MKLLKFECVKFICHSPHCTHTHAPVIDKWKVVASISLLDRGPWNDCQVPGETFFFCASSSCFNRSTPCSTDAGRRMMNARRFTCRWPGVRLSGPVESATRMENSGRQKKRKCSKFLPPERIPSRFHTSCDATFPFDGQFVCLTTKNTPPDDSDAQLFLAERWHKRLESHSLIGHYARQMLVQFLPNGPHYCVDCISFPSKSRSAAPGGYFKLSTALEQGRPIFLYYVQNSVLIFENYFLYKTIFCVK